MKFSMMVIIFLLPPFTDAFTNNALFPEFISALANLGSLYRARKSVLPILSDCCFFCFFFLGGGGGGRACNLVLDIGQIGPMVYI